MTETTSPQPSTGSSLHPSEVPALVDALEAKIAAEPRIVALDDVIKVLEDYRDAWEGQWYMGIRAIFDEAITRVLDLKGV